MLSNEHIDDAIQLSLGNGPQSFSDAPTDPARWLPDRILILDPRVTNIGYWYPISADKGTLLLTKIPLALAISLSLES